MPPTHNPAEQACPRVLRLKEVVALVGLKRSSVYAKVAAGCFPRPIKLGGDHASGWLSTEVQGWIEEQIRRSRPS